MNTNSLNINTKTRSELVEIMDDFNLEGDELRQTLDKIASINRWLGGNSVTLIGVKQFLRNIPKTQTVHILDLGCGQGDMLRYLVDWARKNNRKFAAHGIDANLDTINYARTLSQNYPEITYSSKNLFSLDYQEYPTDIVISTLTLHHFSDREIATLLNGFLKSCRLGFVVNDLHRSKLACRLFQALSWVFQLPAMPKYDGLVSIMRGFKKDELEALSNKIPHKKYSVHWKWAFRYLWIIQVK